jgi:hypothetical protein
MRFSEIKNSDIQNPLPLANKKASPDINIRLWTFTGQI